jgi:uncharacterized protein
MLYALICIDKPDSLDLRLKTRADHIAFLGSLGDKAKFAGPFLDDDGKMVGTMAVVEAENREAAETLAAQDPYAKAGLFQSVEIRPWRWALKNPESA